MTITTIEGIFAVVGLLLFLIFYFFMKRLTKHREIWDDIPDIKFQEELNKTRKKMKVPLKKINYKTGKIK